MDTKEERRRGQRTEGQQPFDSRSPGAWLRRPSAQLSIIVEFIAGKVTQTIDRLIALYRPDSLIVGTRGMRSMKMLGAAFGGMGSVSKCVP